MASIFDYLDPADMEPIQSAERRQQETTDERWRRVAGAGTPFMRNILQGPTFGFGDELLAGARALGGEPYQSALESERRLLSEYSRGEGGIQAGAEQLLGALAGPGIGTLRAFQKLPWDWKAKAIGIGTGEGALAGAGTAEGGAGSRLSGAMGGAVLGAPLGLAGAATAIGATNVLGRMAGDAPGLFQPPRERAEQRLRDFAREAGVDPAVARNEAQWLGPEGRLADVEGFSELAEGLGQKASQRGPIADVVYPRNQGQYERLLNGIREIVQVPDQEFYPALQRLEQQQSAQARSDYRIAYATEVPPTPKIETVLNTPAGRKALSTAMRAFENDPFSGRKLNDFFEIQLDEAGNIASVAVRKTPDMRAWDDVKRAFDEAIESETTGDVFRRLTADGRRLVGLKRALVEELDAANPAYRQARMNYADAERLKEAATLGRERFFKEDPEILRMKVDEMSDAEYEAWKVGAFKAIQRKLGGPSRRIDKTKRLDSPDIEEAFAELVRKPGQEVDAERYAMLGELIARERRMYGTAGKVLQGSPTDRREQVREYLARHPAGNKERGYIATALDALFGNELPTDVLSEMRIMLFSEDPSRVINMLESMGANPAAQEAFERLVFGVLAPRGAHGGAVGGIVGGETAFQ